MAPDALCFDMYGTLCDTSSVGTTLGEVLGVPNGLAAAIDEQWRAKQLQYSYQRGQMDDYAPFWEVTDDALAYALDYWNDCLDVDAATRETILAAYNHLDPFTGAADALATLRDAGFTVTVLSNGNPEMLETLAANAGLDEHLDAVISAHEVRTFKPAAAVYANAATQLDRDISECVLVSANAWDVAGAAHAGMGTVWVNRSREPFDRLGNSPEETVRSLSGVADAVA